MQHEWKDDGAPDWRTLKSKVTTAAKPHDCDTSPGRDAEGEHVCGIEKGQRYHMLVGLEDGKFTVVRNCLYCPKRGW